MKKYLLARDNNGPASYSPRKRIAVLLLDLMRNEEESTHRPWPAEKNEVQKAAEKTEKPDDPSPSFFLLSPFPPSKQKLLSSVATWAVHSRIPAIKNAQASGELKENPNTFRENRNLLSKKASAKRGWNAAAIFFGLLLSSFLVKILADGWTERALANNYTARPLPIGIPKEKMADKFYQNALVRITVPPSAKEKKKQPKPASLKDIRKQVGVKGNAYTVGYFGGISGLQLTVSNGSEHFINQVEVEVQYLERNDSVVETETYQIRAMKPHSFQTLSVPPAKKGAKVTCKIMNIYSRQYRSLLKEI